jgi:hypothetical protein
MSTQSRDTFSDNPLLRPLSRYALGMGVALALPCLAWLARDPVQFERSYLVAFLFVLAPAGGSLALLALHRLTGGRWGDALSELLTAAARSLPWLALAFVPVLLGLKAIFPWAAPGWAESEGATAHKVIFLDVRFFIARAVVYLALWSWLARVTLSRPMDPESNRSRARGALTLLAYVGTTTLAAVDWGMSLGPEWYSTMYGLIIILGQALSALTLAIIARWFLDRAAPDKRLEVDVYHDLGTLVFAFVMTWAYLGFSQFLIIWSANMPEEVTWYMERLAPGWKVLATSLVALHFAVPFLLLLLRKVKRKPAHLAAVCGLVLAARLPELIWLIVPAFHPEELSIHWLDVVLPLALLCLWTGLVLNTLRRPSTSTPEPTSVA